MSMRSAGFIVAVILALCVGTEAAGVERLGPPTGVASGLGLVTPQGDWAAGGIQGVGEGSLVWGDYDNDGDQDLLVVRRDGANVVSRAFRSDSDGLHAVTECTTVGNVTTCEGDQSAGVNFNFPTGPAVLKVLDLTSNISPAEGTPGIRMRSDTGAQLRAEFVGGEWVISTNGDKASGIEVISVGPNGARGTNWYWYEPPHAGGPGSPGTPGGTVAVDSRGAISTHGEESHGILATSQGGRGGNGGDSYWANGGNAGKGGDGGAVTVLGNGTIETFGDWSYGILARSEGGMGGTGGSSDAFGMGKNGGWGGRGGAVTVDGDWSITTHGFESHGISAQSLGGGGGTAGNGSFFDPDPGSGGASGHGGSVLVISRGTILTLGDDSHGIFAESVGGYGGTGGGAGSVVNFSANGGSGGDGGVVEIRNEATVATRGDSSNAIFAQSIGGGGGSGGSGFGLFYSSGGGGSAGGNGGLVTIQNSGALSTTGVNSRGIFAQSVGGGGGDGGKSGGMFSFGGAGATTSDGGNVSVVNSGAISTGPESEDEDRPPSTTGSQAIFAQSVGGGGGNGGFSGGWFSLGGAGGGGGGAGTVRVENTGELRTHDDLSSAILAQSVGGGGGNGGGSVVAVGAVANVSIGGTGGDGGDGDTVNVSTSLGSVSTEGDFSHGILAQSIGGGGGNAGFAVSGSTVPAVKVAIGGSGGLGGDGGEVRVHSGSNIGTSGSDAYGIMAQSVGGGGGTGGFGVAGSLGGGVSYNLGFGGSGGSGGSGGTVTVGTLFDPLHGLIATSGDRSYGIMAQSVGGGGGSGGFAIAAGLLSATTLDLSFGGKGGVGGGGGAVFVNSDAQIATGGENAHGILAQSVGGGGGAGGWSLSAGATAFGGAAVSLGGSGGPGAKGGVVDVATGGVIETSGDFAHGILAQSIGGGGGTGGMAGTAMLNFSSLIPMPPQIPVSVGVNFAIGVGGKGGVGGTADTVNVANDGAIVTHGDFSQGILAQSIGGGGGAGGKSVAATVNVSGLPTGKQPDIKVDFALAIGGSGGSGNHGGVVDVSNTGAIDTQGDGSHGILAQSIGGGGGTGGNARAMTVGIDPAEWAGIKDPMELSMTANVAVGGSGGTASNGGRVSVENSGTILTRGADAHGIFAQSIGGGGGAGGGGYHGLDWADLGVEEDWIPDLEGSDLGIGPSLNDVDVVVGGRGGASGSGSAVDIANSGTIRTLDDGSFGILAQSIGGGGGVGGVGALGDGTVGVGGRGGAAGHGGAVTIESSGLIETFGTAAHAILAQSIGGGGGIGGNVDRGITDFGLNLGFGGSGGNSGNGSTVLVNAIGDIVTHGDGSSGIIAQSVGGGGGIGGGIGFGLGFGGSVGGVGSGGALDVDLKGNITTLGDASHGIVAQSAGGQGFGGEVNVTVDGDVLTYGKDAHGIVAQSRGNSGSGDISVLVQSGTVQGGSEDGAGVLILNGHDNVLTNHGKIVSVLGTEGTAIRASGNGNETIENLGLVAGLVDLAGGANLFYNRAGGVFESGSVVNLGTAGRLTNEGIFSPGGSGLGTTTLYGDYVQTATGTYEVTVNGGELDKLIVLGGSASLDGKLEVVADHDAYVDGNNYDVLTAEDVTGSFDEVVLPKTAFLDFDLESMSNGVKVTVDVTSFAEASRNPLDRAVATALDGCLTHAEGDMSHMIGRFQLSSPGQVSEGFYSLSPASYDNLSRGAFQSARLLQDNLELRMDAARSRPSPEMAASTGRSYQGGSGWWLSGGYLGADQDANGGFLKHNYSTSAALGGYERAGGRSILGASFGYAHSSVELDNDHADGTADGYFGSLYGGLLWGRTFAQSVLSVGKNSFDNRRDVHVGAEQRMATSDYDGTTFSALVTGGRRLAAGSWGIEPYATMRYARVSADGFTEQGAGSVNLIVDGHGADWLQSDLGVRFTTSMLHESYALLPELHLAWNHDFGLDRDVTAAFQADPSMPFTLAGEEVDSEGVSAGVGLTYHTNSGWKASVRYERTQRGDYQANGFMIRLGSGF